MNIAQNYKYVSPTFSIDCHLEMIKWINSTVEFDDYNMPCKFCLNTPILVRFARPQAYGNDRIARIFEMVVLNAAVHMTINFKDIFKQVENGYLFISFNL